VKRTLPSLIVLLLAGCASDTPRNFDPMQSPVPAPAFTSAAYGPGAEYDEAARNSFAAGEVGEAGYNFEQALEVNPFDAVALNNLAVARAEQGQYFEATDLLQRASRLAPDNAEIAGNLARLRYWTQNYTLKGDDALDAPPGQTSIIPLPSYDNLPPAPPELWSTTRK